MVVAALMIVLVMISIMDMLMLVHLSIVIMRMGMFICAMATHSRSPPIYYITKALGDNGYLILSDGFFNDLNPVEIRDFQPKLRPF